MIKLDQVVIVEGKYDKIKLSSLLDACIIETNGFGIFKDPEKLDLIRRLAQSRGIVIVTDSDSAGFLIRHYIQSAVPKEQIKNVYIPEILGKEKRKSKPSKAGTLGVEGIEQKELLKAFERAGVFCDETVFSKENVRLITKADFYEDGLSGKTDSAAKRQKLLKTLNLPAGLSANALLPVLNSLMNYEEYRELISSLEE